MNQPNDISVESLFSLQALQIGDQAFQKKMILMYMDSFEEFKTHYRHALINRNVKLVQELLHKMRPAFQIIQVDLLNNLIDQGVQLVKDPASDTEMLTQIIERVEYLSSRIISDLSEAIQKLR
jgi:hypothetical protein